MSSQIAHRRLVTLFNHLSQHSQSHTLLHNTCNSGPVETSKIVIYNNNRAYSCIPKKMHYPTSEKEIIDIIELAAKQKSKVKVIGAGHSPNDIMLTNGHMISLDKYNKLLFVDRSKCIAKVQAGIRLWQLNEALASHGLALSNLGTIDAQSIAGAISTGTHGTGIDYGILATQIIEMRLIIGSGKVLTLSREENPDIFAAALCGLGCLGIISTVTIQCEPSFDLHSIQLPMKLDNLLDNINELIYSSEHYRFWWFPHTDYCVSWGANRVPVTPKKLTTVTRLNNFLHSRWEKLINVHLFELLLYISKFIPSLVPIVNILYFYMMYNRKIEVTDAGYKVFGFDCRFAQFVNEWAIPIERTAEAMKKLKHFIESTNLKVHLPIEVRFSRKDDIWLSPNYNRDCCWIGIIMYRPYGQTIEYLKYFRGFEKIMISMGGRPHWAKEFSLTEKDFAKMYPRWKEFKKVREYCDPEKIFWNEFLERVVGN